MLHKNSQEKKTGVNENLGKTHLGCASVWQSMVTSVPDGAPTSWFGTQIIGETVWNERRDFWYGTLANVNSTKGNTLRWQRGGMGWVWGAPVVSLQSTHKRQHYACSTFFSQLKMKVQWQSWKLRQPALKWANIHTIWPRRHVSETGKK